MTKKKLKNKLKNKLKKTVKKAEKGYQEAWAIIQDLRSSQVKLLDFVKKLAADGNKSAEEMLIANNLK
jgi:hypothetical protein